MTTPHPTQPTEATLVRLAKAIFAQLTEEQPDLAPRGKLQVLSGSVGGRNYLFRAKTRRGPCLLKLRRDPDIAAFAEYDALDRLPPGLGPAPWAYISMAELRDEAMERQDLRAIKALDLPVGDGLLMSWLPGTAPSLPLSQEALHHFGACLSRFHHAGPTPSHQELPPHSFPQRPSAMLRLCDDLFDELQERELLSPALSACVNKALKQLHKHRGLKRLAPKASVQSLCHGDLRWHNLLQEGEAWHLIDWEDAGMGDPAIDLALFVCRTPLSWWQELCVLEAYDLPPMSQSVLNRFFVLRPLVGLLCAMSALLNLVDVFDGVRPITESPSTFIADRWQAAEDELAAALRGVLGVWTTLPEVEVRRPTSQTSLSANKLIAIDGPSVSFKSPFAAGLARRLGLPHYNKGVLFRYVALWAHCHGRTPEDAADRRAVCAHLKRAGLRLLPDGALAVGEERIESALFHKAVEAGVAAWAALPQIREALAPAVEAVLQAPCVLEGRDIGTEVAPHADAKFYVTASKKARVAALVARGDISEADAKAQITSRDRMDREREHAPLRQAEDAIALTLKPSQLNKQIEAWAQKLSDPGQEETP